MKVGLPPGVGPLTRRPTVAQTKGRGPTNIDGTLTL